jgi:membrane protein
MGRVKSHAIAFLAGLTVVELAREVAPGFRRVGARRRRSASDLQGLGDHPSPTNEEEAKQPGRGRQAEQPSDIPPKGWKDILLRTFKEFSDDQIPLISAGCTFYTLLALFPGIGAFVALYGLFADVGDAQKHVQAMSAVLPGGAISLIGDQMVRAAAAGEGGLSLAFILGLLIALWSANGAMKAVITGLNIAYEEKEKRGVVGKILVPLAFTLGFLAFAAVAMGLAAVGVAIRERMGSTISALYTAGYWALLFVGLATSLTLLYRFGPSRRRVRWRWISWGSGLAAVVWLSMSAGFSFYAANFGHYDKSYGALGAAIGFMTWTWLSTMVLLLGAELNSEIEHQTAQDTTVGAPKPLGLRGAVMADTVGEAQ